MATSLLMASDHNVKNVQALSEDYHQTTTPKQRRRRKSKANDQSTQKKKPPQRGMGVAQLERLRLQERWKKMTEMSNPLPPSYNRTHLQAHYPFMASAASSSSSVADHFAKIGGAVGAASGVGRVGLNHQGLYLQRVGHVGFNGQAYGVVDEQFRVDFYGVGGGLNADFLVGNDDKASQELSSMPNIKCSSDRCGVCYKNKRVKGKTLGYNGVRDIQLDPLSINGCGFVGYKVGNNHNNIKGSGYAVGSSYQSVEVVAVHRRGCARGGGVVVEYDFFPEKVGGSSSSGRSAFSSANDLMMMKLTSSETHCTAAEANREAAYKYVSADDATGVESSSCVDLSLKLCYY